MKRKCQSKELDLDGEEENNDVIMENDQDPESVRAKRLARLAAGTTGTTATTSTPSEICDSTGDCLNTTTTVLPSSPPPSASSSSLQTTLKKPPPGSSSPMSGAGGAGSKTTTVVSAASKSIVKKDRCSQPLEDVFIQALAHVTGSTIELSAPKKTCTRTNARKIDESSVVLSVVRLKIVQRLTGISPSTANSNNDTSEELMDILQNASSDFFAPFRTVLFPSIGPSTSYSSKMEDGVLYKIASMYSASTTWIRDNGRSVALDDDEKQKLGDCLQSFRRWLMNELAGIFQREINEAAGNSSKLSNDSINDAHVELGLFQDESYGGLSETMAVDYLSQRQGLQNRKNCEDCVDGTSQHHPLMDEFFRILGSATGTSFLGGTFMTDLIREYDERNTTHEDGESVTSTDSSGASSLCTILLSKIIQQLPLSESTSTVTSFDVELIRRQLTTLQNFFLSSSEAARTLSAFIFESGDSAATHDGATLERICLLRPLFHLAAFTVPRFTSSSAAVNSTTGNVRRNQSRQPFEDLLPQIFHNRLCEIGTEYPVCIYAPRGYVSALTSYKNIVSEANLTMKSARLCGVTVLTKIAKAASSSSSSPQVRSPFFVWLNQLVDSNEALNDLLESDLLSPDTAQAYCSSRPFLLGITTSLLEMTLPNLWKAIEKDGHAAFDFRYFYSEKTLSAKKGKSIGILVKASDRCLVPATSSLSLKTDDRFSGSTEFFFLIGALLRLSLFSGIRVNDALSSTMRHWFANIHQLADKQIPKDQLDLYPSYSSYQKLASTSLGWDVFVRAPEISQLITSFSLLQLRWCSSVVMNFPEGLPSIPEWLVKLPSQWLAYVSVHAPQSLTPQQGVDAVLYTTKIMAFSRSFSPPVLCQMIRICGGFIKDGVRRARVRENTRSNRGSRRRPTFMDDGPETDFEGLIDDRSLDIYSSFDQRDLGVTVFADKYVQKNLLSQLLKAYVIMDMAEGVDVEKEYRFEKHSVKNEILDVFLFLYNHGAAKKRFLEVHAPTVAVAFCSSIAEAFGFVFGHACQNVLDIRDIRISGRQRPGFQRTLERLSPRDESNIAYNMGWCVNNFLATRRMLLVVVRMIENEKIANVVGQEPLSAEHLGNMFINSIAALTGADGGTHHDLELSPLRDDQRSAVLLQGSGLCDEAMIHYFLYSRRYMLLEYGIDVSICSHILMAVAAKIHLAARGTSGHTSPFLEAIARNELCNLEQLRNVLYRLCVAPRPIVTLDFADTTYILERDGFVELRNFKDGYEIPETADGKTNGRRRTNRQDMIQHSQVDALANRSMIEEFLNDLDKCVAKKPVRIVAAKWGTDAMTSLESRIVGEGGVASEEDYGKFLSDYMISSTPLQAANGNLLHSFNSIIRSRSAGNAQPKRLIKEARMTKKLLPSPHPATSIFVCFAEERMDVCKAAIVGPDDTPFAGGLWLFDILFPNDYPASPPLCKFLTTGNGRTRVSSNLYSDGKVCLSLLGTYNAYNDEQRWRPEKSTLAQLLVSVQQQLLNDPEPFFSEGFGHEGQRGTKAGVEASKRFNHKIRLHTVQHAIIAHLKHPPIGFEEVTKRHFALCRQRIVCKVLTWIEEARKTSFFSTFVKAYEELVTLLSKDDIVRHRIPGLQGNEEHSRCPAVSASKDDVRNLSTLKPCLAFAVLNENTNDAKLSPRKERPDSVTRENVHMDSEPYADDNESYDQNDVTYEQHIGVLSWLCFNYFADRAVVKVLADRIRNSNEISDNTEESSE